MDDIATEGREELVDSGAGEAQFAGLVAVPSRWARRWRRVEPIILPVVGVVVGLLAWHWSVIAFDIPQFMLPAPLVVAETVISEWTTLRHHAIHTAQGFGLGFLASVLVGVPLAVVMAFSRVLSRVFYPLIVASQALPKVALAPLFLVWVGFGLKSQVLIAFLIAFFPVLINTVAGLQGMPRELHYLALSMGGGPFRTFFKVRLPYAMPSIWAGFKVAIILSVVGSVVGEFVASNRGLGFLVAFAAVNVRTALAFATLTVLASLAIVAFLIVDGVGRLVVPQARNVRLDGS